MYICLDFDGTVVDHAYPAIGQPVPHALETLRRLQRRGARIILWTMRSDGPQGNLLQDAVDYLEENGIHLFGINHNPDQTEWTSSPKAYGHIYIDDAGLGCPLITPKGFNNPCVDWKKVWSILEKAMAQQ